MSDLSNESSKITTPAPEGNLANNATGTPHHEQVRKSNLITVPFDTVDKGLEQIRKASLGISVINQIYNDLLIGDNIPYELRHLCSDFHKGALHDAIEILTDAINNSQDKLFNLIIDKREVEV